MKISDIAKHGAIDSEMKSKSEKNLIIVYTIDSNESKQVQLPVRPEDIYVSGFIDRIKVMQLAASNEVESNRAVLDPFVMDVNGNIL